MPSGPQSGVVTVITRNDPLTPAEGAVALLLECAPDASLPCNGDQVPRLEELIGPAEDAKRKAWKLTQNLIAGEPSFGDVLQLHVMEEIIIRELENIFHAVHLDGWLRRHGTSECHFRAPSPYIDRLRSVQSAGGSTYKIVAPLAADRTITQKVRRRLQDRGVGGIRESLVLGARRFFPNVARLAAATPGARKNKGKGGWWFYSTAYTFTNIGLAYEPHLPQALNYLVDSSEPGMGPLRERSRDYFDLYAWANWSDLPGRKSVDELRNVFRKQISSVALRGEEDLARNVFLRSAAFQTYLNRTLPLSCFHSRIFKNFLDDVRPEVVFVGNAAFEGPLLQLARKRGIPTVLLQHGILGDYYQLMDQPADTLLVRGSFWKEFVAESMRPRTRILNVPTDIHPRQAVTKSTRSNILFLTSVDAALTHTHESDLREILTHLLIVADTSGRKLVIRVHPMEPIGYYRRIAEQICVTRRLSPTVEYSQGPGLENVLLESAVAVTYASTVFLDCLRLGIPIISFAWHDFSYKALIERHGVFHFARDFADLDRLVREALAGQLSVSSEYQSFLAPTTSRELHDFFRSILSVSSAAPVQDA